MHTNQPFLKPLTSAVTPARKERVRWAVGVLTWTPRTHSTTTDKPPEPKGSDFCLPAPQSLKKRRSSQILAWMSWLISEQHMDTPPPWNIVNRNVSWQIPYRGQAHTPNCWISSRCVSSACSGITTIRCTWRPLLRFISSLHWEYLPFY